MVLEGGGEVGLEGIILLLSLIGVQQVKINGQAGLFTARRGQLRKYSNFSGE